MDALIEPFEPPAPKPRSQPPSRLQVIKTIYRNPIELWGEPAYANPVLKAKMFNESMIVANQPDFIRHILVDNAKNYRMARVRQLVLRPILRDGLLTAEGPAWKRSRRAVAPVFTPRHAAGFADQMLACSERFAERFAGDGGVHDVALAMTDLTYEVLAATLFSEDPDPNSSLAENVARLLDTMGRVDPLDLLKAPEWIPRLTRIRGRGSLNYFRKMVREMIARRQEMLARGEKAPEDFLTLLIAQQGPDGLTEQEVEDNILTFLGAGHETTARALGWTIYCLANAPREREHVEEEVDRIVDSGLEPVKWLDAMPYTRAAFEEAMRLYPPAPSINREAIADDRWGETEIPAGTTVLVLPWILHRHKLLWDRPNAFIPERFLPENRAKIGRFQYLPFGAGPRVCIGATFALQEAAIALGVLMKRFRFDCTQDTKPWPVQRVTTQPLGGLPMTVTTRR
ncbi:cytochrome P450 [Hoeflea sp. WL0058]|uniref:Cytochrome P450 n=1 Tax=Flavimaribacter sediminis TaxID=2865987 RepID=A0AAE3D1S8_9HYPH|nr:cytochrome P450 [Flavimaribacter sediminis]MBW8638242.1 cytochrome P450 [Flavimaribacter sediminis]